MTCPIGLQLYSLRDAFARDWAGTLGRVAEMGCDGVELAAKPDATPNDLARALGDLGLRVGSMHVDLANLLDRGSLRVELDWAQQLECDLLIVPWVEPPTTGSAARRLAADMALAAQQVRAAGLGLAYHNHDFEFSTHDDGRSLWQHLQAIEPEVLGFELDLGWLWHAGIDPGAELARLDGRCPAVHIKDFSSRLGRAFCPVGEGQVPLETLIAQARTRPDRWLIAEQDDYAHGLDPFDSMARSCKAIRRWLA